MITVQDFLRKCEAFGFDAEMLEKCEKYYIGCRTPKRNDVIESGDIKTVQTAVNRWNSLQGVTRKPRGENKEYNPIDTQINVLHKYIKGAETLELKGLISSLEGLIEKANEQIKLNKDSDRARIQEEIAALQKELAELE